MILGLIIGIFLSLILFTIAVGISSDISVLQIAQTMGSIVIAISSLLALSLYRQASKKHKAQYNDKASLGHLKQALQSIEKAYSIFTSNKVGSLPRSHPLLWKTTARLIIRYERTKKYITATQHRQILQEHDEYWREQFYELLTFHRGSFNVNYFAGDINESHSKITPKSIAVIFDFSSWHDDKLDVLKEVDNIRLLANGAVDERYVGVKRYFELDQDLMIKVLRRKNRVTKGGMLFLYLTMPSMLNII